MDYTQEIVIRNVLRRRRSVDWYTQPRYPNYHTLTWVDVGVLDFWADGVPCRVGTGEAFLIPGGMEKRAQNTSGLEASSYSILFYAPLPKGLHPKRGNHIRNLPVDEFQHAFNALHKHWLMESAQCCRGYLEVILGLLVAPASANDRPADPRVERMRQYVVAHFEETIRLETLAAIAGVSRGYAGTLFHQQFGTTVQNYANTLRVRKAQGLLCESWDTLEWIAEQCGFDDPFYFSKVFKKHTGLSPTAYRKQFS